MEPSESLHRIETALRNALRQMMPDSRWLAAAGAPSKSKLGDRRDAEAKRRDGVQPSTDLLDYAETYELTDLIEKNWEVFKPIFDDHQRTKVYFGIVKDVRNSVAHSRDLVPFERELLSGIAGQLRNQVAEYRSVANPSQVYYPVIEIVRDSFGREGFVEGAGYMRGGATRPRLNVGDTVRFEGTATTARGRQLEWLFARTQSPTTSLLAEPVPASAGEILEFEYLVTEDDVQECLSVAIGIRSDSRFHRFGSTGLPWPVPVDDYRTFDFAVSPPFDQ